MEAEQGVKPDVDHGDRRETVDEYVDRLMEDWPTPTPQQCRTIAVALSIKG